MTFGSFFSNVGKLLANYWHVFLLQGLFYTLLLSVIAVSGGTVLGALFSLARRGKFRPLKWAVGAVIEVVRGTPVLLQLYMGVFVFPLIVPALKSLPDIVSVSIVLVINSACYTSEIIRSGIQAVDIGQTEAARSLGLSEKTAMMSIVLPQAVKNILPALGNEFITVIKETSLASTFFVGELMTSYLKVKSNTLLALESLFIVGVIYFAVTFTLSRLLQKAERRMKHA